MSEQEVFVLADRALNDVVGRITDDQWDMVMPPEFLSAGQESATLRDVVNAHAYDDAWVPDMLTGATMSSVGEDKFRGDLLGDNPRANFAILTDTACDAVQDFTDLDLVVHTSFGDYPAREYLWQITSYRGLRAYDFAVLLGFDAELSDELVTGLWEQLAPVADDWREYGVFGPRVEVAEDAPLLDRLLGLTGRTPAGSGS